LPQIAFALGLSTDEYVAPRNNVFYLRYALDDSKANDEERFDALRLSLTWRANEGLSIVTSARQAVNSAMAGKTWNNDPVRNAAHPLTLYVGISQLNSV
jgi:hypothetical protein